MSKIICDICGTSYAETAKQCPICGSVRPGDANRVTNEVNKDGKVSTGYTYVKGGRFSKSNVKKRAKANGSSVTPPANQGGKGEDGQSNRGLVITAIILLLGIIGVVMYIAISFFGPFSDPNPTTDSTTNTTGTSQVDLSCKDITLDTDTVLFEQEGDARLLSVTVSPANTTDKVSYKSDNKEVATVSSDGKITAVGNGTATITVTCGSITRECKVTCQFPEETSSDPTEDTTVPDDTTKPAGTVKLNRKDITFSFKGESWVLYSGDIAKNLITWGSEDESVATFADGQVVAVGGGMTEVFAEYEGQKVSCIIRCNFEEGSGVGGNGGVSEDGGDGGVSEDGGNVGEDGGASEDGGNVSEDGGNAGEDTTYAIYSHYGNKAEDISIGVGEIVMLYLKDSEGNTVDVTWSCSNNAATVSGNTITGALADNAVNVTATYNGVTYTCIVRIHG